MSRIKYRRSTIATLGEDARENLRIQTDFESVMYPITGYWKGQRAVKGHDLSCGGVAFHTPQALRPGEVVQVVLPVTDSFSRRGRRKRVTAA